MVILRAVVIEAFEMTLSPNTTAEDPVLVPTVPVGMPSSHALRGRRRYWDAGASRTAFPRRAWERDEAARLAH